MKLEDGVMLRLHRGLSIKYDEARNEITVGLVPPTSRIIKNPPAFLPGLLEYFSDPRSYGDCKKRYKADFDKNTERFRKTIEDLIKLRILVEPREIGRYDRHLLYFDLIARRELDYENVLRSKTVALIGTGGIGSTCSMLLTAAGVGKLILTDEDIIEESNLTRTILFDESDVGKKKVAAAKKALEKRNSGTTVEILPKRFSGKNRAEFERAIKKCDFVVLSADSPEGHPLLNEICHRHKIPHLNAGYIETNPSVGPLIIPEVTSCTNCERLNRAQTHPPRRQLNSSRQAPSYGPVNALSSSIAVNEVLRYLLGLDNVTHENRILIDSRTYEKKEQPCLKNPGCDCCGSAQKKPEKPQDTDVLEKLASIYGEHREKDSMNKLVLDQLILDLMPRGEGQAVLDIGCGIGTLSIPIAEGGAYVTALDLSPHMLETFKKNVPPELKTRIDIQCGNAEDLRSDKKFDAILLNLIVDYIEDPVPLLRTCNNLLKNDGYAVVVVPHPFKDSGKWQKMRRNGKWDFASFLVDEYFVEGLIEKHREDHMGNLVLKSIKTYKRTMETYFDCVGKAGFNVATLFEPKPLRKDPDSVNYRKLSRIPYFLVLKLIKSTTAGQ